MSEIETRFFSWNTSFIHQFYSDDVLIICLFFFTFFLFFLYNSLLIYEGKSKPRKLTAKTKRFEKHKKVVGVLAGGRPSGDNRALHTYTCILLLWEGGGQFSTIVQFWIQRHELRARAQMKGSIDFFSSRVFSNSSQYAKREREEKLRKSG